MSKQMIEKLEAKLKLWETPGFLQFIEDLHNQLPFGVESELARLKLMYLRKLEDLREKESKFKQTKLDL